MVRLRYLSHSFFEISFDGCKLLIDPYFSCSEGRAEFRRLVRCPVSEAKLKDIGLILISHEHFDHFDKKAVERIAEKNNAVVASHDHVLNEIVISERLKRPLSRDQQVNIKGVNVTPVVVHHPNSFYPLGFKIECDGTTLFHAGDTDLSKVFSEVKCDMLMLPIGGTITMDVVDAVRAVKIMKPDIAIPMHYNTFEMIRASPNEFKEKIKNSILKTKPVVLKPGETFSYEPCRETPKKAKAVSR